MLIKRELKTSKETIMQENLLCIGLHHSEWLGKLFLEDMTINREFLDLPFQIFK
jgi:hypothetical protein